MVTPKHKTKLRLSSVAKMEVKGSAHFLLECVYTGTTTFENRGTVSIKANHVHACPMTYQVCFHADTDKESVCEQTLGKLLWAFLARPRPWPVKTTDSPHKPFSPTSSYMERSRKKKYLPEKTQKLTEEFSVCSRLHLLIGPWLPFLRAVTKKGFTWDPSSVPLRCLAICTTQERLSQGPESQSFEMWSSRRLGPLSPSLYGKMESWLQELPANTRNWPNQLLYRLSLCNFSLPWRYWASVQPLPIPSVSL